MSEGLAKEKAEAEDAEQENNGVLETDPNDRF